jgi:transposase
MDERVRFVARLLDGENMAALCREFAISRKTGYKIFDRYKESGLEALTDRSRRPWRYGNQLPQQVEAAILNLKREKPYWGARKICERLLRRFSCEVKVPARSSRPNSMIFSRSSTNERPHQALDMNCPAEVYTPSPCHYRGLPELDYPFHDSTIHVTSCGRSCLHRKKINLSTVFAGQAVGIKEVEEGIWLVSFMDYDLGYIDLEEKTLQPLDKPFSPKVLPT